MQTRYYTQRIIRNWREGTVRPIINLFHLLDLAEKNCRANYAKTWNPFAKETDYQIPLCVLLKQKLMAPTEKPGLFPQHNADPIEAVLKHLNHQDHLNEELIGVVSVFVAAYPAYLPLVAKLKPKLIPVNLIELYVEDSAILAAHEIDFAGNHGDFTFYANALRVMIIPLAFLKDSNQRDECLFILKQCTNGMEEERAAAYLNLGYAFVVATQKERSDILIALFEGLSDVKPFVVKNVCLALEAVIFSTNPQQRNIILNTLFEKFRNTPDESIKETIIKIFENAIQIVSREEMEKIILPLCYQAAQDHHLIVRAVGLRAMGKLIDIVSETKRAEIIAKLQLQPRDKNDMVNDIIAAALAPAHPTQPGIKDEKTPAPVPPAPLPSAPTIALLPKELTQEADADQSFLARFRACAECERIDFLFHHFNFAPLNQLILAIDRETARVLEEKANVPAVISGIVSHYRRRL